MEVSLTITTPDGENSREIRLESDELSIGRSSRCDIRIPTRSVSGHHLTLSRHDGQWSVIDERSTNGTTVNGAALPSGQPRRLEPGDVVKIGEVQLGFDAPHGDALLSLEQTGTLARQLVGDLLLEGTDDDLARIEVRGPEVDEVVQLEDSLNRAFIGRDEDCLICLPDVDAPRLLEVSRVRDGFGIRAVDVTGRDSVRLNDAILDGKASLSDGDVVVANRYRLAFFDPLESLLFELDDSPQRPSSDTAPPDDSLSLDSPGPATSTEPTDLVDAEEPASVEDTSSEATVSEQSGLSATEWAVLAIALFLMVGAAVLLLTVFEVF